MQDTATARNMSVTVKVGLLSGRTVTVQAGLDEAVGSLKRRAQTALGVGNGRLLDSSANVLDTCVQIKKARVQTDDSFTLHIRRVQVQGSAVLSNRAFTALLGDGSAVAWGAPGYGGDHSVARDRLKDVQHIQVTDHAFAGVLGDASVECAADSSLHKRFCCHSWRRIGRELGACSQWW